VLLHLAFPDAFERIASRRHKQQILEGLIEELSNQTGAKDRDHNGTSVHPDRALCRSCRVTHAHCPPARFPTAPTHESRSTKDESPWGH
jgi:hypothetical protein